MAILVVGSFMMDHVVMTPQFPQKGETLIGTSFNRYPGGKGANQAVAASRLGADVWMLGNLGNDSNKDIFLDLFHKEGIHTEHVSISDTAPTGVSSITVNEQTGENQIIIVPGANMDFPLADVRNHFESIQKQIAVVLIQNEIPQAVNEYILKTCHEEGIITLYNPAPALSIPIDLYPFIDYLTPNETELSLLSSTPVTSVEEAKDASRQLLQRGAGNVIATLGEKGALLVNHDTERLYEAKPVAVVDTVAAGDAFNGALAYALTRNWSLDQAIPFANQVGALTVTQRGAIPSLPYMKDVEL